MKNEWLQVRISPEEKERLRLGAQERGLGMSEFVLTILNNYLDGGGGDTSGVLTSVKKGVGKEKGSVLTSGDVLTDREEFISYFKK